jgi:hypothetical protein
MKRKILPAITEVFSLTGNDYSSFVVKGGASEIARKNWNGVGCRLNAAASKVGQNVQKKQAA